MDPLGWGFEAAFYKKLQRLTYVVTIPNRVVHGTGHILNPSGRFLGYLDPWSHNQLNEPQKLKQLQLTQAMCAEVILLCTQVGVGIYEGPKDLYNIGEHLITKHFGPITWRIMGLRS